VEYVERGKEHGILFMFSLLCEYIHLEYERIHVIYRVNQTEYLVRILVVAPQEYVNIYSTRRLRNPGMMIRLRLAAVYGLRLNNSVASKGAAGGSAAVKALPAPSCGWGWPLHDIATTNIVWHAL